MDRNTAIAILNLKPEPADRAWRHDVPTGQLVRMARQKAMKAPRLPSFPSAEEANAVVAMFNALDTRQAAARRALEGRALREHAARLEALGGLCAGVVKSATKVERRAR